MIWSAVISVYMALAKASQVAELKVRGSVLAKPGWSFSISEWPSLQDSWVELAPREMCTWFGWWKWSHGHVYNCHKSPMRTCWLILWAWSIAGLQCLDHLPDPVLWLLWIMGQVHGQFHGGKECTSSSVDLRECWGHGGSEAPTWELAHLWGSSWPLLFPIHIQLSFPCAGFGASARCKYNTLTWVA